MNQPGDAVIVQGWPAIPDLESECNSPSPSPASIKNRSDRWPVSLSRQKQHSKLNPVITISNEQLITRCRRGDNRAWQQLVERYGRLVHSIPVRYGLSTTEVDDVGQEVFLALAEGLATLDDPESLPAWLMTTARRYSWRAIQRRKRENPLTNVDLAEAELVDEGGAPVEADERVINRFGQRTPSMTELLEGWQRQEILAEGLGRLGERCRDLLTLVFLDQHEPSYDEISEQLAIPKGSIGPTRNRCLQQLRSILEGIGFGGKIAD